MAERVSVKRSAELLGMSQLSVRVGMAQGTLPIGAVIRQGTHRSLYHISPHLLAQYTGLSVEDIKDKTA